MTNPTPIYIVCSPRPRVGKTLIARLLLEFFRANGRPLAGFDLHPREPGLAGHFPHLVSVVDLTDTQGQMALFDRLIADDLRTKVIDLSYAQFDRFFEVMWEIGFIHEAKRRMIEPIILFAADPAPATVHAYAELRRRFASTAIVPVHNDHISVMIEEKDFPPTRAEGGIVRIGAALADRARRDRPAELLVRRLHGKPARRPDRNPPMDRADLRRVPRARIAADARQAQRLAGAAATAAQPRIRRRLRLEGRNTIPEASCR